MGMGVVRGEREKGSCGEGERADGYGLTVERLRRGVDGWAGLGYARRRRRGCVCVCVNVRGRVRDREKMRVL